MEEGSEVTELKSSESSLAGEGKPEIRPGKRDRAPGSEPCPCREIEAVKRRPRTLKSRDGASKDLVPGGPRRYSARGRNGGAVKRSGFAAPAGSKNVTKA